ncbi:possible replication asociated protein [Subterranean clover stunt C2 alphasatellite]|uniref:Para-Rep C2 n=1 Tax=Subterranean clover stunt C2 alphasatellite TaxID=1458458 RepID=REP2_SCSC2|nr:possible replication asociated protein [Subterranean clover stunt C2 alphasatellite]Q87009.1 RecName: Full=Para-Rep C2; Short=Rep2; AltName: Full=Replication-associated protein of non-essential DNA C2 [Subterranean clover stunt virus (strain F)]AAA68018.1 possible replication asociated protein [Subterranean clover stunt C2 alphasatellite]
MARRYCFTLNYATEIERETFLSLFSQDELNYFVVGDETATTGQKHLQGFVSFKNKIRLGGLKKKFGNRAHWEIARGSDSQNRDYCCKETLISEIGIPVMKGSNKRKTMEIYEEDPEEMQLKDPDTALRCKAKKLKEEYCSCYDFQKLRPWQIELHAALMAEPDDRSIIWVYGSDGGEGKTSFAKELIRYGWFYTAGGKTQDVLYMYAQDPERNIAFDVPRCSSEMMNYQAMEMLKNRVFASTKYRPVDLCIRKLVHLIVFANVAPDPTRISEDRLVIINC